MFSVFMKVRRDSDAQPNRKSTMPGACVTTLPLLLTEGTGGVGQAGPPTSSGR